MSTCLAHRTHHVDFEEHLIVVLLFWMVTLLLAMVQPHSNGKTESGCVYPNSVCIWTALAWQALFDCPTHRLVMIAMLVFLM
jgi:hypothetical protein